MTTAPQPIQANLTFAAPFLHRQLGISYTQEFLSDPEYSMRANLEEQRLTLEKKVTLLGPSATRGMSLPSDPEPVVRGYVTTTMPMILGCKIDFQDSEYPHAQPLDMSDDEVMALEPIVDFSNNPVMQDLEAQAAWLRKKYGRARIALNMQSVINIVFKLRGDQLMFDFFEKPQLVHKLVETTQQTWINARQWIERVNRENGMPSELTMVTIDNCNAALISPDIYREFFAEADRKTVIHYQGRLGIHHCGGNMEKFAADYASLGHGIWYDIGYGSNVKDCIEAFRIEGLKQEFSVRFGPARLRSAKPRDIRAELDNLAQAGASYISSIGTDPDTSDENLKAFWGWQGNP